MRSRVDAFAEIRRDARVEGLSVRELAQSAPRDAKGVVELATSRDSLRVQIVDRPVRGADSPAPARTKP